MPDWSNNLNKKSGFNTSPAGAAAAADKSSNFLSTLKGVGSDIMSDVAFNTKNFFNPNAGGKISYGLGTKARGGLDKAGLNLGGVNLGKFATIGAGVTQGLDAIGGLSEMSDLNEDTEDLLTDITLAASGNPLVSQYLSSEDMRLLNKIRRGNYDTDIDLGNAVGNLGGIFSGALSGAATGALGGIPGLVVGGVGGAINSGIDNMNSVSERELAKLESLYQNLLDAEQQYKAMRRPNLTGLGIQQRYQNMYM
jgi:hypothetical protein